MGVNALKHTSRGIYLLEYALSLPIILVVLLGAADTVQYMRTYLALRNGVEEGLRCLYPSDGACIAVTQPATVAVNDLYIPPLSASQKDYDGVSRRLLLPDYTFGPVDAWVLSRATFDIEQPRKYGIERELFSGEGRVKIIEAVFPNATGHVQDARLTSGTIVITANPALGGAVNNCTDASQRTRIGTFNFFMPQNPLSADPDLTRFSQSCIAYHGGQRSAEKCGNSGFDLEQAPIVINLRGDGYVIRRVNGRDVRQSDGEVKGFLKIDLERYEDDQWVFHKNLGGQYFTAQSGQNFIPRGITFDEALTFFPDTEVRNYAAHFDVHGNVPARYNQRYRIVFSLAHVDDGSNCNANEAVGWDLNLVDIRMPHASIAEEKLPCLDSFPRSSFVGTFACAVNTASSEFYSLMTSKGIPYGPVLQTVQGVFTGVDQQRLSSICYESQDIDSMLNEFGIDGLARGDYKVSSASTIDGCTGDLHHEVRCPENYGVSQESLNDDMGRYVTYSPEVGSLCLIPSNARKETVKAYEQMLSFQTNVRLHARDCTYTPDAMPADLLPDQLKGYKKISLPSAVLSSEVSLVNTGNDDPLNLVKSDPRYSCSNVKVHSDYFDEMHLDGLSDADQNRLKQSLFFGAKRDLGCRYHELLKGEAVRLGASPDAFFAVSKALPVSGSGDEISPESIDSCMTITPDQSVASTNHRVKVSGGPFEEGDVPVKCLVQGKNICIAIPAGIKVVETDDPEKVKVKTALAVEVAKDAIQAFSPCDDKKGCSDVEVQKVENGDAISYQLTAKTTVPTFILSSKGFDLSYSSSRSWEGSGIHSRS